MARIMVAAAQNTSMVRRIRNSVSAKSRNAGNSREARGDGKLGTSKRLLYPGWPKPGEFLGLACTLSLCGYNQGPTTACNTRPYCASTSTSVLFTGVRQHRKTLVSRWKQSTEMRDHRWTLN